MHIPKLSQNYKLAAAVSTWAVSMADLGRPVVNKQFYADVSQYLKSQAQQKKQNIKVDKGKEDTERKTRERNRLRQKKHWANMTPESRDKVREADRLSKKKCSEDQEKKEQLKLAKRKQQEKMNEDSHDKLRETNRLRQKKHRANMTEECRDKVREADKLSKSKCSEDKKRRNS